MEFYRESHSDLIQLLLDSFYVYNLTTGTDSEGEAHSVYAESKGGWIQSTKVPHQLSVISAKDRRR